MEIQNNLLLNNRYLSPGTVLNGRYLIEKILGEGGFSITYQAIHIDMQKSVAIKEFFCRDYMYRDVRISDNIEIIHKNEKNRIHRDKKRFLNEARILADVSEIPGIVHVTDFFQDNETAYIVMDLIKGDSLEIQLEKVKILTWNDVINKIIPVIKSLSILHKKGLIHRDIKPSNFLITEDGDYTLIDFGAALHFVGEETHSIYLSDGYAPKEQYLRNGKLGPYTDVYALCALIYRCITGIIPENSIQRSVFDELKWPSDLGIEVPKNFENAIMKGLNVEPEQRWQDMGELYDEFVSQIPKPPKPKKIIYVFVGAFFSFFIMSMLISILKYPEIQEQQFANSEESVSICLSAPEEMTAYEFDEAIKLLKKRVYAFAGEKYLMNIEPTKVTLTISEECFEKQDEWSSEEIIDICFCFSGKWTLLVKDEKGNTQNRRITSDNIAGVELKYGGFPVITNSGDWSYFGKTIDWSSEENYYLIIELDEDTADFLKNYLSIQGFQFYAYTFFNDDTIIGYEWVSGGDGKTVYFPIISSKEGGKRLAETVLQEMQSQNYSEDLILNLPETE